MNVNTEVLSPVLAAAVAAMLEGVTAEAAVRGNVETMLAEAGSTAWTKCRDAFLGVLFAKPAKPKKGEDAPASPVENAKLLLAAFRSRIKEGEDANPMLKRGKQYASDLNRAVKAIEKGKTMPEELKKATRAEWTSHEFWKEAGVLAATGRAASRPQPAPAAAEESEESESVGEAASPKNKVASELAAIVDQLRGPFWAEYHREAMEMAIAILAKQRQAAQAA